MICGRCGDSFTGTDLLFPEGDGFRHWVYCPSEHLKWLKGFKVYQAEFNERI